MNGSNAAIAGAAALLLALHALPARSQTRAEPGARFPQTFERPQAAKSEEPSVEPGREIVAFELVREKPDPERVTRRLAAAVAALLGQEAGAQASAELSHEALSPAVSGKEAGSWVRLAGTPLLVKYQAQYDELRVLNEELDVTESSARDIGIQGARDVAERFLKRLAEAEVLDARHYERAVVQVGTKLVGDGPLDEAVKPGRVAGYRVTYRPRLHGFQLANAGLRLGITAAGEVESLRVGGVTPLGEWRAGAFTATGAGGARKVRIGPKALTERFYREAPKGVEPRVAWSRVLYVMPEGVARAVVEPMLVVSYTQVRKTESGPVASRRRTLAYSLTDPKAAPLDFDAPAPTHEGTAPVRKN
jgi:hypothetical protein